MIKFKDWLIIKEVGTCTGSIASFSLPLFGGNMVDRIWPSLIGQEDKKHNKKHKKKKKKE
jgi:hypothetical protein